MITQIEKQKEVCQRIIKSKENMISEMMTQVSNKDDDYIKVDSIDTTQGYHYDRWLCISALEESI